MIIESLQIEVNWKEFKRGASFFIPCLDVSAAKKTVNEVMNRLRFKVLVAVRIEEGIKGLRVWRL